MSVCPVCGLEMETLHAHLSDGEHVLDTAAVVAHGSEALAAFIDALEHGQR